MNTSWLPPSAVADPPPARRSGQSKCRVVVADDHPLLREGLTLRINGQRDMEVVGEAGDGPSAIESAVSLNPDVVVIDITLPGLSGVEVTKRLTANVPCPKVIALTIHEDPAYLRLLRDAGAVGYVLKRSAPEELLHAIRAVARGDTFFDPRLTPEPAAALPGPAVGEGRPAEVPLSPRETEIVQFIAKGFSNKEIAAQLGLSVKTVETYKTRSLEKLGLRSRVDIVRHAVRHGWLTEWT